jgi:predicted permease
VPGVKLRKNADSGITSIHIADICELVLKCYQGSRVLFVAAFPQMKAFFQDFHYAIRSLRKARTFTWVAILTLALGISANTIVFSVVSAALLRPIPYPNPEELMVVSWSSPETRITQEISGAAFFQIKNTSRCFSSIAAIQPSQMGVNVSTGSSPRYLKALAVSGEFFQTLGTVPEIGASFGPENDEIGGLKSVVISHRLWVQEFDKKQSAIGSNLQINGDPYRVIGIMPGSFHSYPEADLWFPLQMKRAMNDRANDYRVIVRLKDGVSRQQAQQELDANPEYRQLYPLKSLAAKMSMVLQPVQIAQVGEVRKQLVLLFGAVVFVLLITCTNVGLLLLVRVSSRTPEIAMRVALGSSIGRLLRTFYVEGLILTFSGGLIGLLLGKEALPAILLLLPTSLSFSSSVYVDFYVCLFVAAVSILTWVIVGIVPAIKLSRGSVHQLLQQWSRGRGPGREQMKVGRMMISAQTALTLILLASSALLISTFLHLQEIAPGFNREHVTVAQVSLGSSRYHSSSATALLLDRICSQLKQLPGVENVGAIKGLPLERGIVLPVERTTQTSKSVSEVQYRMVNADYFSAMRIPIIAGRVFKTGTAESEPVALVNSSLAQLWWPNQSPIGEVITIDSPLSREFADMPRHIIGVVADIRETGLELPPSPTIFVLSSQAPDSVTAYANKIFLTSIVVRAAEGTRTSEYINYSVQSVDPTLPVASLRPLSEVVSSSLVRPKFYASLMAAFGAFALVLIGIGLYGLLSYHLVLRTREMGVRMVMGAGRGQVIWMIIKQGVKPVIAGVLLGLVAVPLLRKVFGAMLYNLPDKGLPVLGVAVLLILTVSILVSFLTALRATSIEPMAVLRME